MDPARLTEACARDHRRPARGAIERPNLLPGRLLSEIRGSDGRISDGSGGARQGSTFTGESGMPFVRALTTFCAWTRTYSPSVNPEK